MCPSDNSSGVLEVTTFENAIISTHFKGFLTLITLLSMKLELALISKET